MKKIFVMLASIALAIQSNAQEFKRLYTFPLDENLTELQAGFVSMNSDTLLDLFIAGVVNGQLKVVTYDSAKTKKNTLLTEMKSGYVQVADWNRDNRMDLLVSGKTITHTDAIFCFTSNGDFTFTKQATILVDHSGPFRVADLNNDALPDLLTFGPSLIRIYRNSGTTLTKEFELTDIDPSDVAIFDMNKDGSRDFVVSGLNTTSVFINQSKFKFQKIDAPSPLNGTLSLADLNNDGNFDITIVGKDGSGTWISDGGVLISDQLFDGNLNPQVFTGDISSDGQTDIVMPGAIRELSGTTKRVDSVELITQLMGDNDRDGDLDLIQLTDSTGSQWVKYHKNISSPINNRPAAPGAGFAISTFNKTYIFWVPSSDDHTPGPTITYDVWLGTDGKNIIAPSFSLSNSQRTIVAHGNAGTSTSMVVNGLTDSRYFYGVQAVDNAYNGSYCLNGGVLPCFDLAHIDVQACKGSTVNLAGGANAIWFSLSKGFIAQTSTLNYAVAAADTLFAFVPQTVDCSKNKVFVIHANEGQKAEDEIIYACKDKTIALTIDETWTNITWDTNPLSHTPSINFLVTRADTVRVESIGSGCEYRKNFYIRISEPVVEINGDGFQVMKGNSVQLNASGTAEQWEWDPSTGLNNSTLLNPLATPAITTEYILTGTDSVGCTASDTTQIIVVETAFVPNLFTPNGDGKNDNLVIYGLTGISRLDFRIFNREGTKVYDTKDLSEATTTGWNGLIGEVRQPSGIYYWKVDGEMPDGSKLLLNGKATGTILLVH